MTVIGIVLVAIGLPLATAPQQAMRGAASLRSIGLPSEPSTRQLQTWRAIGGGIAGIGLVLLLVAFL